MATPDPEGRSILPKVAERRTLRGFRCLTVSSLLPCCTAPYMHHLQPSSAPGKPHLSALLKTLGGSTGSVSGLAAALIAILLLGGCATTGELAEAESPVETVAEAEPPVLVPERPLPDDSVYPLLLAEFALRRRDFDTAMKIYLEQAEILRDPAVSAHATHLAQFLQRERDAFRAVRTWAEIDPENVEANNTLATLLARQGRTREALPHLSFVARSGEAAKFPVLLNRFKTLPPQQQAALDRDVQALIDDDLGDNVSLLLTHALMAEEASKPDLAMERLGPVFAHEPYQQQALILEAKLLLGKGAEDPLGHIEEALEVDPSRSALRLQYARLLASKDMDAARKQFEILSAEAPNNTDLLFSLAMINHELKDDTAAKAYLRQVIAQGQRKDEAYFFLGQLEMREGNNKAAISLFQQVGDGEDLMRATLNIARLQLAAGNDAELAAYMNRLRESYPPRREQLYALEANLYSEAQRDNAGLALLARAIDEFPESDNLRYARSVLFERRGDIAAAETDLRTIIDRDPDNSTALNALGYTLANRTERLDEARYLIEKALGLAPNEPAILDSMGWVLYRQGEYQEALQYLTRAYASFPDPEVAAHLGEVLWASGNTADAMKVWRGALRKDPQHAVLTETLDRLGISMQAEADATEH